MSTTVKLPLYLSWRKLKDVLGWPYGRTHTDRLETDPKYAHDPFPRRGKIGSHRNSHPMWYTPAVLGELRERDGRFRNIAKVRVVEDELVSGRAMPGKPDNNDVVRIASGQAFECKTQSIERGLLIGQQRAVPSEVVSKQRVQGRRVTSSTAQPIDVNRCVPINADE